MNHFSELRSPQDRELLERELRRRHDPATATVPRAGLAALLLRLTGARRAPTGTPAPRGCAPAHDA